MAPTIAYLGPPGSYSEIAAMAYGGAGMLTIGR
jgi:prephenate dehydratase